MIVCKKLFDSVSNLSNDDLARLSAQTRKERQKRKEHEIQEWVDKVNDLLLNCPVEMISVVECYDVIDSVYYKEEDDVIVFE